ncbi:MAG TPA: hypothetical protein VEY30_01605 [Myxococcaceae bacterium]|nr:hypothetical protein [Myxococcaceae bacterium]
MQYTLRNVPPELDAELRRKAKDEGKSLNEVTVEALAKGLGYADKPVQMRSLRDLAGTWKEDKKFQRALSDQRQIDNELWR